MSIEEHDFFSESDHQWGADLDAGRLEICLNLSGEGEVRFGKCRTRFSARTLGHYAVLATLQSRFQVRRPAGQRHRFAAVKFSRDFLLRSLAVSGKGPRGLKPTARALLGGEPGSHEGVIGPVTAMTACQEALFFQLRQPPVSSGAQGLWFQSKALELAAQLFFTPEPPQPEFFCVRQRRLARERVDAVKSILRETLQEPPPLEELARRVGCSPFYLSRTFSQHTGCTIPQYLRRMRMEQAAELLLSGGYNVTEAAFAVGYSSLGHFSKSFCEEIGCCPALFPGARALVERFRGRPASRHGW
ncbi:MAG: helix-turn-helix transcriptional regulator [Verrucomicrobia bacterium]|nr:helix-turn-helix transcriptional regulator [Verrucomicrobiota bacterium]